MIIKTEGDPVVKTNVCLLLMFTLLKFQSEKALPFYPEINREKCSDFHTDEDEEDETGRSAID